MTSLEHLEEVRRREAQGQERVLMPHALVETVASCATLFASILVACGVGAGRVWGGLALTRLGGWRLGPGRPGTIEYEEEQFQY